MFGWNLFGGGSSQKVDAPKNAIIGLTENLAMMEKRQTYLTKLAEDQEGVAKANMHNKRGTSRHYHHESL